MANAKNSTKDFISNIEAIFSLNYSSEHYENTNSFRRSEKASHNLILEKLWGDSFVDSIDATKKDSKRKIDNQNFFFRQNIYLIS